MTEAKPFHIPKRLVWEAFKSVKANGGAAGVDGQTVEEFEEKLSGNLYKVWNRMSSGTYFPPPVRIKAIPKKDGSERFLGIPTVGDRIAQTAVKMVLEPLVEPHFHPSSYGYRPGKSALDAVGAARQHCWRYDWVLDMDIRAFFDSLDHSLVLRAVRKFTTDRWILLYIERWLKAPAQMSDGELVQRDLGTPQGGVVSPLLANIFLHLSFDAWMAEKHPGIPFERYADDVVVHCRSKVQASLLRKQIEARLSRCRLELHPQKTKIVYCKDSNRTGSHAHEKFDFLGYTFRPRKAMSRRGVFFVSFVPGISNVAAKTIRRKMRRWELQRRTDKSLVDLARMFESKLRGWINYYGRYYPSALRMTFCHLNRTLVRWAMRKYKRLKGRQRRASRWLIGVAEREPELFAHWRILGLQPKAG